MRVGDIMSPDPTVLRRSQRLEEAAEEMRLSRIHHLPIVDQDNVLEGLITHRDLLAHSADWERRLDGVMRTDVKTVKAETPAHEAAYLLLRYAIGCLPVTDERGTLIGIVTESDFVRIAYTALGGRVPVDQLELEEKEADQV
jgi:CBS domain-containing protein